MLYTGTACVPQCPQKDTGAYIADSPSNLFCIGNDESSHDSSLFV